MANNNPDRIKTINYINHQINLFNMNVNSPLILYVKQNRLDGVIDLLKTDINVNQVNDYRETALFIAAKYGYTDIAEELIKAGADLNLTDFRNNTAINAAAGNGHLKTVELLLNNPSLTTLNTPDHNGNTPLHRAAIYGHLDVVKTLLEHGADKTLTNHRGITANRLTEFQEIADCISNYQPLDIKEPDPDLS